MIDEFKVKDISVGSYEVLWNLPIDSERLSNYLKVEQRMNEKEYQKIIKKLSALDSISLIKYIEIDQKYQGKGLGNKLMLEIDSRSQSTLFLIAETKNQWLLDWYEKLGFEIIGLATNLPIMIKSK